MYPMSTGIMAFYLIIYFTKTEVKVNSFETFQDIPVVEQ